MLLHNSPGLFHGNEGAAPGCSVRYPVAGEVRCGRVWAVFRDGGSGVSCGAGVDGGTVVQVLGVRRGSGGCVVGGMNGMGGF